MITTPTTFILGAGASVPFGFPTGAALRAQICTELHPAFEIYALLQDCDLIPTEIEEFRVAFERSGNSSIDLFIAHNPRFQAIGELCIAYFLLRRESLGTLHSCIGCDRGDSGWYQMLWNLLLEGVESPGQLATNAVKFITFNYDRSLEQYLLFAIQHTFSLTPDAAFNVLRNIPIHHVYGSLGDFHPHIGFEYGTIKSEDLAKKILSARKTIKTVPNVRPSKDETAALWLESALQVFIMGFGFDKLNCERIALSRAVGNPSGMRAPIFASAFELTEQEKVQFSRNARGGRDDVNWVDGDCKALIRNRLTYLS